MRILSSSSEGAAINVCVLHRRARGWWLFQIPHIKCIDSSLLIKFYAILKHSPPQAEFFWGIVYNNHIDSLQNTTVLKVRIFVQRIYYSQI